MHQFVPDTARDDIAHFQDQDQLRVENAKPLDDFIPGPGQQRGHGAWRALLNSEHTEHSIHRKGSTPVASTDHDKPPRGPPTEGTQQDSDVDNGNRRSPYDRNTEYELRCICQRLDTEWAHDFSNMANRQGARDRAGAKQECQTRRRMIHTQRDEKTGRSAPVRDLARVRTRF